MSIDAQQSVRLSSVAIKAGESSKEVEEGNAAKGVTKPKGPSVKEYEEHMLTHVPYRN